MFSNIDLIASAVMVLFIAMLLFVDAKHQRATLITGVIGMINGIAAFIWATLMFATPHGLIIALALTLTGVSIYKILNTKKKPSTIEFSDNEIQLHRAFFSDLSPKAYMKLINFAIWREIEAGQTLLTKGHKVDRLSLIFSGIAKVDIGNNHFVEIKEGQFIGEMSYISGNMASGTVTIAEKTILVEWPQQELKALVSQDTIIGNCIQSHFNRDLIKKLG
jgi:hypothetical protein